MSSPLSGSSWPVNRLQKVVLPAPLGPITPTIAPGGIFRSNPLISTLSSKPFDRFFVSITKSPNRVPVGIVICCFSGARMELSATNFSKALTLALLLACLARGLCLTHCNS